MKIIYYSGKHTFTRTTFVLARYSIVVIIVIVIFVILIILFIINLLSLY